MLPAVDEYHCPDSLDLWALIPACWTQFRIFSIRVTLTVHLGRILDHEGHFWHNFQTVSSLDRRYTTVRSPGPSRPMRKLHSIKSAKYRMIKPRNVRYRLRQRGIVPISGPLCCRRTDREDQNFEIAHSIDRAQRKTLSRIVPCPTLHTNVCRDDSTTCPFLLSCAQAIDRVVKCRRYDES
jgi:hypothetical protein